MSALENVFTEVENAIYVAIQGEHLFNLDTINDEFHVLCITDDKVPFEVLRLNNIKVNKLNVNEFINTYLKKGNPAFIAPLYSEYNIGTLPQSCYAYNISLKAYKELLDMYYNKITIPVYSNDNQCKYDKDALYNLIRIKLLLGDLAYGDKDINEVKFSNENNIEYLINIRNIEHDNYLELAKFNYDMALDYYRRAKKTLY